MPIAFIRGSRKRAPQSITDRFLQRAPQGSAIAALDADAVTRFADAGILDATTVQDMFKALSEKPIDVSACKQAKRKAYALLRSHEASTTTGAADHVR